MKLLIIVVFCVVAAQGAEIKNRIINGQTAPPTPYHTHILYINSQGNGFFGGGSLITSQHVLTVAHIIFDFAMWHCGIGNVNLNQLTTVVTTTAQAHPSFDATSRSNDIGLVTLPERLVFTPLIQPISLPPIDVVLPYANEEGWISGFGWTNAQGAQSTVLQRTFQRVTNSIRCSEFSSIAETNQFCGFDEDVSGICFGDLGGGLVVNYRGVDTLVGLGSIILSPCEFTRPSAYTRVSAYREWIRIQTGA